MGDFNVTLKEENKKGSASIKNDSGELLAEMTFSRVNDELIIIDHTHVEDELRGQGVGKILLEKIVEQVREEGSKILPLCPFAKSVFDKDVSIRDVLR